MLRACCANGPVPMSLICRVLDLRPNIVGFELRSVRECVFLQASHMIL